MAKIWHVLQQCEEVTTSPKKIRVKRSDTRIDAKLSKQNNEGDSVHQKEPIGSNLAFADFSDRAQERLRSMLINFCDINDLSFFRDINLEKFGIDSGQSVNNAAVQEICVLMQVSQLSPPII